MLLLNCAEQGSTPAITIKAKAAMLLIRQPAAFVDTAIKVSRKRLPARPYLAFSFVKNVVGRKTTSESRIRFLNLDGLVKAIICNACKGSTDVKTLSR
jgi:hypothetical protein